jgi:hypothetical protein
MPQSPDHRPAGASALPPHVAGRTSVAAELRQPPALPAPLATPASLAGPTSVAAELRRGAGCTGQEG